MPQANSRNVRVVFGEKKNARMISARAK